MSCALAKKFNFLIREAFHPHANRKFSFHLQHPPQGGHNAIANKRFKQEDGTNVQPPYYLTPQQLQTLQYLQQNQANLNAQQQALFQSLVQSYRLMHQHQKLQQQKSQTGNNFAPPSDANSQQPPTNGAGFTPNQGFTQISSTTANNQSDLGEYRQTLFVAISMPMSRYE
jgi:hypothetical protein